MATATHERPEVPATFTLGLTEEEALYVFGALRKVHPLPEDRFGDHGHDPVWEALGDALSVAGVSTLDSGDYARVYGSAG